MMALLPNIKRVSKEDLPGSPSWASNLLSGMNTFMDAVFNALNGTLTFGENIQAQIKEVKFETPATYSSGNFNTVRFERSLKTKPFGCWLLSLQPNDASTITEAVTLSTWRDVNGFIELRYISGLENSTKYTASVVVI